MKTKAIIELVERAANNNVNGQDVIDALRIACPVLSKNQVSEINKILRYYSAERSRKPGDYGEPKLFSKAIPKGDL